MIMMIGMERPVTGNEEIRDAIMITVRTRGQRRTRVATGSIAGMTLRAAVVREGVDSDDVVNQSRRSSYRCIARIDRWRRPR